MELNASHRPPKLALKIFRWYCRPDRVEELEGDLEEFFFRRLQNGTLWKAKLFFWWNVLRCYRSYSSAKTQNNSYMFSLFKSYFKLAMRHSWKNKWSVLINVTGLGIALSMCIFIYTIYAYNVEFDSIFENTDGIYRVHAMTFENDQERRNEISPIAMENKLRNEISGVQKVAGYLARTMTVKKGSDYFSERVGAVTSDFFEIFDVPLWYGSTADFGKQPVVFLTKEVARKYFGDQAAVNEKLTIYVTSTRKVEVTVGGVFEKIPLNSSFNFNLIMNQDDYVRALELNPNEWANRRYPSHFIQADAGQIDLIEKHMDSYLPEQNEGHKELKITRFELVPFNSSDVTEGTLSRTNMNNRLRPAVQLIFTVLIAMIFLIACFNLANTSMAMIAKRLKEIGIRKTLGSESKQILVQYLFEMGLISALAFIIALMLANYTSNAIMGLFGQSFIMSDVDTTGVILFIIGFLLFTTLVAGLLPALYAWRFQPVEIMRSTVKLKGVSWLNKTLTIAQYGFSIAVLSAGITFSQNSNFLNELNLGYQNKGIIDLNLRNSDFYGPMKQRVDQLAGVETAGTRNHFANFGRYSQISILKMDTSTYEIREYAVGEGYLDLVGVALTSGRLFNKGSEADRDQAILVSQEFSKRYFDGQDPINEVIVIDDVRKTIVGVVADVIDDVYEDSEKVPAVVSLDRAVDLPHLVVKVTNRDLEEVENELKVIWSELIDQPYGGQLQEDLALGTAKRDNANLRVIFVVTAFLGAFLSIVGIFSLAKLNVARKLKEISIRKVLGASMRELLSSVNRTFIIILLIAMVIGSVLGYFISDTVLGIVYKYYIHVTPLTSVLSGLIIVVLSIIIITAAVLKPANSNPVLGLRDE